MIAFKLLNYYNNMQWPYSQKRAIAIKFIYNFILFPQKNSYAQYYMCNHGFPVIQLSRPKKVA